MFKRKSYDEKQYISKRDDLKKLERYVEKERDKCLNSEDRDVILENNIEELSKRFASMEYYRSEILRKKCWDLDIPFPYRQNRPDLWEDWKDETFDHENYEYDIIYYLNKEGYNYVYNMIHENKIRKFEIIQKYTNIITTIIGSLTGFIGVIIGLISFIYLRENSAAPRDMPGAVQAPADHTPPAP